MPCEDVIYDSDNEEDPVQQLKIRDCTTTFWRLISTCRAIRKIIKRKHSYALLFDECQKELGVSRGICNDVKTRFDSTLEMFDSIICNREVLKRLQERGRRHREIWPLEIHLSADDF